jgi:DNA-binding transcriptional LysR family regulator
MNIHHLELFYYVAKHGGISEAVRNIPYGIQQPAVSAQIIQLEQHLGTTLFHRRPFALTSSGKDLFAFCEPFFSRVDDMERQLQGGTAHHIRIGASEIVLREHLPHIAQIVRKKYPKLTFNLREGYQPQVETWMEHQEIDLGMTLLGENLPSTFNFKPILELPLILIVPRKSPIKSAEQLWECDKIEEPLITLSNYESMCRNFQQRLVRKGLDWLPSIELSSLKLIETYVANGYGIGLFLDIPMMKLIPEVRALPLADFSPVTFGGMWRGKITPLIQTFLDETVARVRALLPDHPEGLAKYAPHLSLKSELRNPKSESNSNLQKG